MSAEKISKKLTGTVTSNKMEKTIVVLIENKVKHPLYKKYYKRRSKFFAHDPENKCQIGDTVRIEQSRPLSRKKRWRLIEILGK